MRLPNVWGLGQAQIHSSLLMMLGLLSLLICAIGLSRTGFSELLPAAITLPVVWIISLAVRVAAQQLVLGECALDMDTTVGPTGNLSTDYEYLPPQRIWVYAIAGQLANLGLVFLGLIIHGASLQASDVGEVSASRLLDLKGGWGSDAWASQIMWVNIFLSGLHMLPTVPFDARALLFALFSLPQRSLQEPQVFRRLANLVTHLATFMLGAGLATLVISWIWQREIMGWYAAVAAAVYLFVAGRWEASRADDLEEQYAPILRQHTGQPRPPRPPHLKYQVGPGPSEPVAPRSVTQSREESSSPPAISDAAAVGITRDVAPEQAEAVPDVDEILRKLHREGRDALSAGEREALLSASRKLQQRRGPTG